MCDGEIRFYGKWRDKGGRDDSLYIQIYSRWLFTLQESVMTGGLLKTLTPGEWLSKTANVLPLSHRCLAIFSAFPCLATNGENNHLILMKIIHCSACRYCFWHSFKNNFVWWLWYGSLFCIPVCMSKQDHEYMCRGRGRLPVLSHSVIFVRYSSLTEPRTSLAVSKPH